MAKPTDPYDRKRLVVVCVVSMWIAKNTAKVAFRRLNNFTFKNHVSYFVSSFCFRGLTVYSRINKKSGPFFPVIFPARFAASFPVFSVFPEFISLVFLMPFIAISPILFQPLPVPFVYFLFVFLVILSLILFLVCHINVIITNNNTNINICNDLGLVSGGSWKHFRDWPHIEVPKDVS